MKKIMDGINIRQAAVEKQICQPNILDKPVKKLRELLEKPIKKLGHLLKEPARKLGQLLKKDSQD